MTDARHNLGVTVSPLGDLHAAIAAQPHLAFFLRLPGSGTVTVRWTGDRNLLHEQSVRIVAT